MFSLEAVRKAVGGVINSSVASSIWKEEFRRALDTRPHYVEDWLEKRPGCDGCSRQVITTYNIFSQLMIDRLHADMTE